MAVGKHTIVGVAGEYHVAAELSRRGWLATVTIKNAPGTDVLAQLPSGGREVAIQTKTASPSGNSPGRSFRLKQRDEIPSTGDGKWFVFVSLRGKKERPDFFVIPRDHVAAMIFADHREWLAHPAGSW